MPRPTATPTGTDAPPGSIGSGKRAGQRCGAFFGRDAGAEPRDSTSTGAATLLVGPGSVPPPPPAGSTLPTCTPLAAAPAEPEDAPEDAPGDDGAGLVGVGFVGAGLVGADSSAGGRGRWLGGRRGRRGGRDRRAGAVRRGSTPVSRRVPAAVVRVPVGSVTVPVRAASTAAVIVRVPVGSVTRPVRAASTAVGCGGGRDEQEEAGATRPPARSRVGRCANARIQAPS